MSDPDPIPIPRIPQMPAAQAPKAQAGPPPIPVKVSIGPAPAKESGTAAPPVPVKPPAPPRTPRLNPREVAFRILAFVGVVASLVLVWFTYSEVLIPRQELVSNLNATVARLSTEIDNMDRRWNGETVEEITNKFSQIPDQIISDQPELAAWLRNLNEQVVPLALDAKTGFGKTVIKPAGEDKLAVIPTTITLNAQPAEGIEGIESPYQRVVRLVTALTMEQRRADIIQLKVTGGEDSVTNAAVVLNLWAGEETSQ